jgi:hypothetical protein
MYLSEGNTVFVMIDYSITAHDLGNALCEQRLL